MRLYTGNNKKFRLIHNGRVYKIKDVVLTWVKLIKAGDKTIDNVPENLKQEIEALLSHD